MQARVERRDVAIALAVNTKLELRRFDENYYSVTQRGKKLLRCERSLEY